MKTIYKLIWALAPLLWGFTSWLLLKATDYGISYTFSGFIIVSILAYFMRPLFQYARLHYTCTVFNYKIPLPPWYIFVALTLTALALKFIFPSLIITSPALTSLVSGVFFSVVIEELVTHSLFILPMNNFEALILNAISSAAFSFMHIGYDAVPEPLYNYLFTRGHFIFCFALGLIAYKTKRIEMCIILHSLSNFVRYTLPVTILCKPCSVPIVLLDILILIILAGGSYKRRLTIPHFLKRLFSG